MIVYVVHVQNDVDIVALPGVYVFKDPLKGARLAKRTLDRISKSSSASRKVMTPNGGIFCVNVKQFEAANIAKYLKSTDVLSELTLSLKTESDRTYTVKISKTYLT